MDHEGLLLVVSGPSGCGKGTVCAQLRHRHPELRVSVSVTTREQRAGEQEGKHYFFRTKERFEEMISQGELLEYAKIYGGHYYGTPKKFVRETLAAGQDVILEIDIQGALQVKERFDEGIFIFLVPPSMQELRKRLVERGRENTELILERFKAAYKELNFMNRYHYIVMNDQVEHAVEKIEAIMIAEKCHVKRNAGIQRRLLEEVEN